MQISSRFTIATHMMIIVQCRIQKVKVTSDFLAASVGVNPVVIRKTLSQLKKQVDLSCSRYGRNWDNKEPSGYQHLDVYQAVACVGKSGKLFSFHDNPNPNCPIGANIHAVLDHSCLMFKHAMENQLRQTSLASGCSRCQNKLSK